MSTENESPADNKIIGIDWMSKVYNWMEETHKKTSRLLAWVFIVTIAFILFSLSPAISIALILIGIFNVKKMGNSLDERLNGFRHWKTIEAILVIPLFGFYFLIALRFFEIDIGAINLRPISPFQADIVNFIGGSILGYWVSSKTTSPSVDSIREATSNSTSEEPTDSTKQTTT